jgi:branched-chain amino acid aminotransferase
LSLESLIGEIDATLALAANEESYIRVIITRGSGPIGLDPELAVSPCRVIIVSPFIALADELYQHGASIHLVPVGRATGGALPSGAKSGNYLVNLMALGTARRLGGHEAVLLDSKGRITEGASSNVFALHGKILRTPPLSVGILEGITRHWVIEQAQQIGLKFEEHELLPSDLLSADEVFLTSTIREVLPVTRIDEQVVGKGSPGPIAKKLRERYQRLTWA